MLTDISILFQNPMKDIKVKLTIEPLAPLSIVSTLPGSYYKSLDKPTKANLCGMFENVLGWHIGPKDRSNIFKKMKQVYKKSYKITEFNIETSAVGYISLLGHLFEIELPLIPAIVTRYDDLWTQQLKHNDKRHMDGTANLSWQVIQEKTMLKRSLKEIDDNKEIEKKSKKKLKDNLTNNFVSKNLDRLPLYYTSPTVREFIVLQGVYQYKLSISTYLLKALKRSFKENNIAYLGTSEGWVNLSIKEM